MTEKDITDNEGPNRSNKLVKIFVKPTFISSLKMYNSVAKFDSLKGKR